MSFSEQPSINPIVRTFLLLIFIGTAPCLLWSQSDFRLSTASMPTLEDALLDLPDPMGDQVVRPSLNGVTPPLPKAEEVLKLAVNALKTRQFESALPKLEYLQSLRASEPDLLILRACIYAESGHPEVAELLFKKTIAIAPSHPWARLNLSEALLSQKKFAEAESNLAILSSIRPESEVVRFKLILALALQKKFRAAEQELQSLQDNAKTPAYIYAKASIAFAQGNNVQGRQFVEEARSTFGESSTGYFNASLVNQGWLPKAL